LIRPTSRKWELTMASTQLRQLNHNGVLVPDPYIPQGFTISFRGRIIKLTPLQEEMAVKFAQKFCTPYVEDPKFNRFFVIEGLAVNHWDESRSFIRVKGTLLDANGGKVEEKTVYCGNILSEKDLKEMSREAIEKSLSFQFGISFSNVNIPPDKSVPFMIVFLDFSSPGPDEKPAQGSDGKPSEVLPGPSAFTVEVVGSQKGSK
jgi:hypothetical protein